ncbi:unnamed protein product [Owenia fusiformis]|uniref:Putative 2'-deoxynucleoside 5'-phosphate N-hydrolase 1 n=1 Tax=Owenia fusiformis TaxID=6347 RepID=A0A8S4PH86_OWEFU|nr:unnamed protein product [Owenia fusiformis]
MFQRLIYYFQNDYSKYQLSRLPGPYPSEEQSLTADFDLKYNMFTIYFCGSIRGGRQDADLYQRIIKKLKKYGKVLTEFVGSDELMGELDATLDNDEVKIHNNDIGWLSTSSAVVAEVTQPSLGVGYELGRAVAMDKKVLCLYRPQPDKLLSAMIRGANNDKNFLCRDYEESELDTLLENFFQTIVGINPEAAQDEASNGANPSEAVGGETL